MAHNEEGNGGRPYIYKEIDWANSPRMTSVYIILISIALAVAHIFIWGIYHAVRYQTRQNTSEIINDSASELQERDTLLNPNSGNIAKVVGRSNV